MDLSDFVAERFTHEIKYASALIMWDRAGSMASTLQRNVPGLIMLDGSPARITFKCGPNVEIVIELGRAVVVVHKPKRAGDDLIPVVEAVAQVLTELLEVPSFTRIGTRLRFACEFAKIEDATQRLLTFKMLTQPQRRVFNQQPSLAQGGYHFRWEGPVTGVLVQLLTESEKFELNPSPAHWGKIEAVDTITHKLVMDIDHFTTAPIPKEQMKVEDWIKNTLHMANRDSAAFLGG